MKIIIEQVGVANNSKNELIITIGAFDDTKIIGEKSFNISLLGIATKADLQNAIINGITNFAVTKNWTITSADIIWP